MSLLASGSNKRRFRPLALTMPAVTVEVKFKGFPTASTHSPTFTSSELPKLSVGKSSVGVVLRSAKSVLGSLPINSASMVEPSDIATWMRWAPSMTWWFVTIHPWRSRMTPLPDPCATRPGSMPSMLSQGLFWVGTTVAV